MRNVPSVLVFNWKNYSRSPSPISFRIPGPQAPGPIRRPMPLPNFLIIGAQKAGTTWLLRQLRQHPDIYLPREEVHFFDKQNRFEKGRSWYRQFFEDVQNETAIGEKTPDYCWTNQEGAEGHLPSVHRNIHETLPDAKLIMLVRNPVDRAVSAVNHLFRTRRLCPKYSMDALLTGDKHHLIAPHGVLDYGRYYQHIQTYLELFDREQLLVLVFEEDVLAHPEHGLEKVTQFLGVDPSFSFTEVKERQNPAGVSKTGLYLRYYLPVVSPLVKAIDKYLLRRNYKKRPTEAAIRTLYEMYRPENEALFQFLGRRIPSWTLHDEPS